MSKLRKTPLGKVYEPEKTEVTGAVAPPPQPGSPAAERQHSAPSLSSCTHPEVMEVQIGSTRDAICLRCLKVVESQLKREEREQRERLLQQRHEERERDRIA